MRERDRLVLTLAVSAGAVDAVSWFGLGKVFSAFMTGNLVFAGGADGPSVSRVLAALLAFALAALLLAHTRSWAPVLPALLLGLVVALARTRTAPQVTGWASQ